MIDKNSSLTLQEQVSHPDWVGKFRELKQIIAETQGEVDCFV